MKLITSSADLADVCAMAAKASFVTVDTEFMRERTYWPKLCLIQLAIPDGLAVAIDPLAPDVDLAPVYALMADTSVVKVFHAARQDVEIFVHQGNVMPTPLYDTQVAAMVCGFGDQVGYEPLARALTGATIDKSSRFTDWSRRPLADAQIDYALSDVIHLRDVYLALTERIAKVNRAAWVAEEMATLASPSTYDLDPDEAWRRIKVRTYEPRFLGILKELAAWRERTAQRIDVPRNRVIKDEALVEIAARRPTTTDALGDLRAVPPGTAKGRNGAEIVDAVRQGLDLPKDALPRLPKPQAPRGAAGPTMDLLRVLLRLKCEEHEVAPRLVASSSDIERLAAGERNNLAFLSGWRREVFGEAAEALLRGDITLGIRDGVIMALDADTAASSTARKRR